MIIAKLIDNVWATRKSDAIKGYKLMLAETLGGTDHGKHIVVIDTMCAGIGDRVIVATGSSARRMAGSNELPIDAAVVGIIDDSCDIKEIDKL